VGYFFLGENDAVYLVRCTVCNKENYLPAVATGVCVWCGGSPSEKEIEEAKKYREDRKHGPTKGFNQTRKKRTYSFED